MLSTPSSCAPGSSPLHFLPFHRSPAGCLFIHTGFSLPNCTSGHPPENVSSEHSPSSSALPDSGFPAPVPFSLCIYPLPGSTFPFCVPGFRHKRLQVSAYARLCGLLSWHGSRQSAAHALPGGLPFVAPGVLSFLLCSSQSFLHVQLRCSSAGRFLQSRMPAVRYIGRIRQSKAGIKDQK